MKMKIMSRAKTFCPILPAVAAAIFLLASCSRAAAPDTGQAQAPGGAKQAASGQPKTGAPGASGGRRQAVVTVQATVANMGQLTADRDTAGVVTPVVQSQVAAQVAGIVSKVPRLAGDWANAGDVVVQLDDLQLKLSLANAQATLENAKINLAVGQDSSSQANPKLGLQVQSAQSAYDSAKKNYEGQKALFDLGGISASQLDTSASQLSAAEANLEGAKTALDQNGKSDDQAIAQLKLLVSQAQNQLAQAELNLQNTGIKAPFAGQIAAINVQPGMYVSLNTPAFTLVSGEKQILFNVSPPDSPSLSVGTKISFEYAGASYPVRVKQVPSSPINGVVPLVATIGSGFPLPFGTVGNVSYLVPLASGILVPLSSLETLENQNYVFTIDATNRVATKNVQIISEAGITSAVSGLTPGDVVVVSPPPGLIPGTQVQPVMMTTAVTSPGAVPAAAAPSKPVAGSGQGSGNRPATGQAGKP
jgi:multidrug efflux pump subunit AcrA (membrane-fusion protein)